VEAVAAPLAIAVEKLGVGAFEVSIVFSRFAWSLASETSRGISSPGSGSRWAGHGASKGLGPHRLEP
jgi:hypothetical protein